MATINQLEIEIEKIKERNKRVESDKAWETSLERKVILALLTYVTVVIFFSFARLPSPFVNAIIPSLAFVVSTLTLPFFKEAWLNRNPK